MPLLPGFEIAASGMSAQRLRLNLVSSNLANAQTTRTEGGGPYRRQTPVFEAMLPEHLQGANAPGRSAASGDDATLRSVQVTRIREDTRPGMIVHDPDHPDADVNGNVRMPNVNVIEEMVDMISASRSFEANAQAFQTLRTMFDRSLDIGR